MTLYADMSLVLVVALTQTGGPIGVGWSAPTRYTNHTAIAAPITYSVYRSINGNPYEVTKHVGVKGLGVYVPNGKVGERECFKVTAVINGAESAFSRAGCVTDI